MDLVFLITILFMRERQRERQKIRQREKQTPHQEPIWDSIPDYRITAWVKGR